MKVDLRQRGRQILRVELAEAAAEYCSEHGFENVTVDEIAQGIGISRATYFRYFSSKEDAIVSAATSIKETVPHHLREHPPLPGTNVLDSVLAALGPTIEAVEARPKQLRARIEMISKVPALRAQLGAVRAEQRDALAAALQPHVADSQQATAIANVATSATELGWSIWLAQPEVAFGTAIRRAFELTAAVPTTQIER